MFQSGKTAVIENITQEQKTNKLWDIDYIKQLWFWYTGLNINSHRKGAINEEDAINLFNDKYLNHFQVYKGQNEI